MQLLVDNGQIYGAHGNELELHNYRQLVFIPKIGFAGSITAVQLFCHFAFRVRMLIVFTFWSLKPVQYRNLSTAKRN